MKRIISLVLAVMMVLGLTIAFAEGPDAANANKITLSIKTPDQEDQNSEYETYNAYKIFDVTKTASVNDPVNTDTNIGQTVPNTSTGFAYSILDTSGWWDAVSTAYTDTEAGIAYTVSTDDDTGVITTSYFTLTPAADNSGRYSVSLKAGVAATEDTAKNIAKLLNARIGSNTPDSSLTPGTAATVDAGYYLITSSLGSNLIAATSSMTITEKNDYPTTDKEIVEGSTEVKTTDVNVGDTVTFVIKANVPASANQKVVLHDTMETDKLTLVNNSFIVKNGTDTVPATSYTIVYKNGLTTTAAATAKGVTATEDVAAESVITDECTFEVIFKDTYIASLTDDANLTVTFDAILNEAAVIYENHQDNEVKLTYSNYTTPSFEVKVYTYEFDIIKYEDTDGETGYANGDKLLADATFVLLNGSTQMKFVDKGNNVYRYDSRLQSVTLTDGVNTAVTDPDDSTKTVKVVDSFTTDASGKINLEGLDAGEYILRETAAPSCYNKIENDITVTIEATQSGTGDDATRTMTLKKDGQEVEDIQVENKSGALLPSTGGIGTTIFYVLGSVMALGALVLLVTKRRVNVQ